MMKQTNNYKSEEISSVNTDKSKNIAIDGGWGWLVCFGSFMINFILDGTMFSFGLLLLELLEYFGAGKSKTTWVGSSLLGMSMIMGPFVSIMLERFSCRQITIAGTLLSVVAFIVSTFAWNVEMLIILYGIIGGIGFGMSFISSVISVGLYFRQKRALATGIALSGSGFGTFAYAYLTSSLIGYYNWRGTILILSGILLHGVFCGLLFRPLQTLKSSKSSKTNCGQEYKATGLKEEFKKLLSEKNVDLDPQHVRTALGPHLTKSLDCIYEKNDVSLNIHTSKRFFSHDDCSDTVTLKKQMSHRDVPNGIKLAKHSYQRSCSLKDVSTIGTTHSMSDIHIITNNKVAHNRSSLIANVTDNLRIFKSKKFVLLLLMCVCWTVQSVPMTFIPNLGISKHLSTTQAAMLVSIVGIANIIGRVLSGIITDVVQIRSAKTYAVTLFTASGVNFVFPWCESFATLALCCAIFGLCMATVVSMRTIILVDFLGVDRLTQSFGMVALFQGIAFMINAPFGGYLYDNFNSYAIPFSFTGLMYLLSGIFCLCAQCMASGKEIACPIERDF